MPSWRATPTPPLPREWRAPRTGVYVSESWSYVLVHCHCHCTDRADPRRREITARGPKIPVEDGTGKAEARPHIARITAHRPESAHHDFTASRTQVAWRSRLSTSPRTRIQSTAP